MYIYIVIFNNHDNDNDNNNNSNMGCLFAIASRTGGEPTASPTLATAAAARLD